MICTVSFCFVSWIWFAPLSIASLRHLPILPFMNLCYVLQSRPIRMFQHVFQLANNCLKTWAAYINQQISKRMNKLISWQKKYQCFWPRYCSASGNSFCFYVRVFSGRHSEIRERFWWMENTTCLLEIHEKSVVYHSAVISFVQRSSAQESLRKHQQIGISSTICRN